MIVTAIQNFEHGRKVRRGEQLNVTRQVAEQLRDKGLVSISGVDAENPSEAAGKDAPSSASRAARATPKPTPKKSAGGGSKKAKTPAGESSS